MYSELYTLGEKVQFLKEVYIRSPVYVKGPKSFRYFLEQSPSKNLNIKLVDRVRDKYLKTLVT